MNLICNITKILDTAQGFWNIFLNEKFQQFFLPLQVERTLNIRNFAERLALPVPRKDLTK